MLEEHKRAAAHYREGHDYLHYCTVCAKLLVSEAALKSHQEAKGHVDGAHLNINTDGTYSCLVCAHVFKSLEAVEMHQEAKRHRAEDQSTICFICSMNFRSNPALCRHLKDVDHIELLISRSKPQTVSVTPSLVKASKVKEYALVAQAANKKKDMSDDNIKIPETVVDHELLRHEAFNKILGILVERYSRTQDAGFPLSAGVKSKKHSDSDKEPKEQSSDEVRSSVHSLSPRSN